MQLILFFSSGSVRDEQSSIASVFSGADQHLPDPFPAPQTTLEHPASIPAESEDCICTGICSPFLIGLDLGGRPCWRLKIGFLLFVREGSYPDF